MRVGVVALQGDVSEHVDALKKAISERGEKGEVVTIKHSGITPTCDALILPGGESTTLGHLLVYEGIADEIKKAASDGVPIMGTCAGLILMAKSGEGQVQKTRQYLLSIMDTTVNRNAFGRQRESFETKLDVSVFDSPYIAIFIRAPAIVKCGESVKTLAKIDDYVVAAEQGNLMALAFHPELTDDLRFHHHFLDKIS
ncbi:SNO glutamine amidotransferase [Methanohalobium evestigatum Z-7303]|uniref:Pyridoxal 5'-phosphate synthase subunit PdxT n=1 Tax=Methanohalobium evestigatum (strain ATCC BAA-1072 / DSM 3721 / NBRC 107634 / OCM 161 / Z-7303) TaxID=644295 RepID=D7E9I3_METEZ|nr:pyridoxal 5'-phosphate synthase glutaminase subunit PdxT [Methanohalobium evestigatum]ADI74255.1 SNO glutamine amidotransferase [Methanohalobium evestigatum Z-7303]